MRRRLLLLLLGGLLLYAPTVSQPAPEEFVPSGRPIARVLNPHTHQYLIHSSILDNSRIIHVYLPPGYADSDAHYPVLYVNDGDWGVYEAALPLMQAARIRKILIVTATSSHNRGNEYTPVKDDQMGGGQADAYALFLIGQLMPFIQARYRCLTGPANTGILGTSLGGLVSLYLGWSHPDTFGLIGAMSPSLWWGAGAFTREVEADPRPTPHLRIWLDAGCQEHPTFLTWVQDMHQVLQKKGYPVGYFEDPNGRHDGDDWRVRLPRVLIYLLGVKVTFRSNLPG